METPKQTLVYAASSAVINLLSSTTLVVVVFVVVVVVVYFPNCNRHRADAYAFRGVQFMVISSK